MSLTLPRSSLLLGRLAAPRRFRPAPLAVALAMALSACSSAGGADGGPQGTQDSGELIFPDGGNGFGGLARSCTNGGDCSSGTCGTNGLCCAAACLDDDPVCGTSACAITGTCEYPDNAAPCGAICADGQLRQSFCDGKGRCGAAQPTPCPAPYGCALGGSACATTCLDDTNCAPGAYCNAEQACVLRQPLGFCSSDDQCRSGRCGVAGTGACCLSECNQSDLICGAIGCDPTTGACLYPAAGAGCGAGSCSGSSVTTSHCDGLGTCGVPTVAPCPGNLVCEANSTLCREGCQTGADCVNGTFCDLGAGVPGDCCPPPSGNLLYVDNTDGTDGPCCGDGPGTKACGSVTRAMQIVRETQSYGATILATRSHPQCDGNGNCLPWGSGGSAGVTEQYPIQLGYGVTLEAPGVTFAPASTASPFVCSSGAFTAFWVTPYPEEDGGAPVTLRGMGVLTNQAVPAVTVGPIANLSFFSILYSANFNGTLNVLGNCNGGSVAVSTVPDGCNPGPSFPWQAPDDAGNPGCQPCEQLPGRADCEPGLPATAVLDNFSIQNPGTFTGATTLNFPSTDTGPAIYVGPGSSLTLGPGPVTIALTYDPSDPTERLDGIDCFGNPDQWAQVNDIGGGLAPVLSIGPTNVSGPDWAFTGRANGPFFGYAGVVQSNDPNLGTSTNVQSASTVLPNGFSNEIALVNCTASLTAGPVLGSAFNNVFATPQAWQCNYDGNGITVYADAGLVFGSTAQPGLIHCMGNDGIFIPGLSVQNDNQLNGSAVCASPGPNLGPTVQILGATVRNNNGTGIDVGAGTLTVQNSAVVNNNVGIEIDGPDTADDLNSYDWGCGPNGVSLNYNTIACNGSNSFFQPSAELRFRSTMFNEKLPAQSGWTNAGADLWDQWYDPTGATNPVIDARSNTWTDYAGGHTIDATCDPISNGDVCFLGEWDNPGVNSLCQCKCAGPGCPFTTLDPNVNSGVLPDGLDIVQWGPSFGPWSGTPSTINVANGQAVPGGASNYCGGLQFTYSLTGP